MAPKTKAQQDREAAARVRAQQILDSVTELFTLRYGYSWRRTAPRLSLADFRLPGCVFALEVQLARVGQEAFIEVRRYGQTIARSAFFDERKPVELARYFKPPITIA